MGFRNTRLRTKVTALLVSLAALWAFAAWVTLREGVNLLWVTQLNSSVVDPSVRVLEELQKERRFSVVELSDSLPRTRRELEDQHKQTDRMISAFRESAGATVVGWATDDEGAGRLTEVFRRLDSIKRIRQAVGAGRLDRVQAMAAYADVIDPFYHLYGALATLDDKTIAKEIRALSALSRAREILSREDALLTGVLTAGRLSPVEHAEFTQTVGAWRMAADLAAAELHESDRVAYDKLVKGASFVQLAGLERQITQRGPAGGALPFGADEWKSVSGRALHDFNTMVLAGGDRVVDRAVPVAVNVVVRLVLAGGLGLMAVIASIVLSITTTRQLLAQLRRLRDAALDLSNDRLPGVVDRIGRGEDVDVAAEAPPLRFGDDEIGQVGQAFNTVQRTAIRVAAEQAELRRSIRDILLSLARRTQGLVHRQLTVLDVMERRETDPEELKELFRLDHLAIRMRRNAENLIVLSGSSPARTWRRSVPMVDVVRGALAEVEDYTRVTLLPMGDVVLVGRAVGDVIHLLAELIENAVSFSPPYTSVQVGGQLVANGYVIEIEDRGLGMKPEDLAAANERIANPPEFRITGTARLGLYVVSQLARRHDIQVVFKTSPYGGTTVVVLLPQEVVQLNPAPEAPSGEGGERLPRRQAVATAERPATVEEVRTIRPAPLQPDPDPAPRPESPPQPRPEPEQPPAAEFTPSGLPLRVPQANLAPALRDDTPTQPDLEEDDDERSPEEIRAMMGSLQSGTRLGRREAARMLEDQPGGEAQ
ncbi:MAG TPA: nitrate- and nitrite sensing domain-containing protein [Nonomuraea sp.]|nr:nitrate- and nitrite sensing domain-containing protein [Nonomuraea sp.]